MTFLVIGTGAIGQRHADNLSALGETVTRHSIRAEGIAGLEARLASETFEATVLGTATQVRLPVIKLLAAHGLPVYIEKPVAYRNAELQDVLTTLGPLANRSFAGFMMRYHPAVQYLTDQKDDGFYRFAFDIGHDVNQWRANWSFTESYASNPDGGGVLLDLCHELDMAHTILGGLRLNGVSCLSHPDFPGVDFSTSIALQTDMSHGTVSMDYLSPVSTRKATLWSRKRMITFNFATNSYQVETGAVADALDLSIDRQAMFRSAMADFIRLVRGEALQNPIAPILSKEVPSLQLICDAYEQRVFTGELRRCS